MTPAEKLGFVVGGTYVVKEGNPQLDIKPGDKLVFDDDDGTEYPWFYRSRATRPFSGPSIVAVSLTCFESHNDLTCK